MNQNGVAHPSHASTTPLSLQQPHVSPSPGNTGPQFFRQTPSSHSQTRSTPFVQNAWSSNNSGSQGLGDFSFIETFVPSETSSLSNYQSHFDRPLEYGTPNISQANHAEIDYLLNLNAGGFQTGSGSAPSQPELSQFYAVRNTTSGTLEPPRGDETVTQSNPHQIGGSSTGSRPSPPRNPPSSSSASTPGTSSGSPTDASQSSEESHARKHDRGWLSTLHIAARRGHERIVKTLTERNIDCNEKDSDGRTALIHASIDGHEPVARLLLAKGARISDLDRRRRSALHWAVLGGHEAVVRLLLEHYAQRNWEHGLDAYDELDWTALHIAIEKNFEAAVLMLLDAGADIHAKARKTCDGDDDKGDTRIRKVNSPHN